MIKNCRSFNTFQLVSSRWLTLDNLSKNIFCTILHIFSWANVKTGLGICLALLEHNNLLIKIGQFLGLITKSYLVIYQSCPCFKERFRPGITTVYQSWSKNFKILVGKNYIWQAVFGYTNYTLFQMNKIIYRSQCEIDMYIMACRVNLWYSTG